MRKSGSKETLRRITRSRRRTLTLQPEDLIGFSQANSNSSNTTSTDPGSGHHYIDPNWKYDTDEVKMLKEEKKKYETWKKIEKYWEQREVDKPKHVNIVSSPDTINPVLDSIKSSETTELQDSILASRDRQRVQKTPKGSKHVNIVSSPDTINSVLDSIKSSETTELRDSVLASRDRQRVQKTPRSSIDKKSSRWRRRWSLSSIFTQSDSGNKKKTKRKKSKTGSLKLWTSRNK